MASASLGHPTILLWSQGVVTFAKVFIKLFLYSCTGSWLRSRLSLFVVSGLLIAVASPVATPGLQALRLRSCSTWT